jgi:hypothetical protein
VSHFRVVIQYCMEVLLQSPWLSSVSEPGMKQPLVSTSHAAAVLGCSKRRVLELARDGKLPLVFNIAADMQRPSFPRIAAATVEAFRMGLRPSPNLERFFEPAFPPQTNVYVPPELAWRLQCDYDHVYKLLKGGNWRMLGGCRLT